MSRPRPDRPLGRPDRDDPRTPARDDLAEPRHPHQGADPVERADGAHAEQLAGDPFLQADPTPPGVDPDEGDPDRDDARDDER
jgi:hypothetical protein